MGERVTKPTVELKISTTANGGHRYELFAGTTRIWLTHALATVPGRDGARARMSRWLAQHPHTVVAVGAVPPVVSGPLDEQEIQFWRTFEPVFEYKRLWGLVQQLVGRPLLEPNTLAGWAKAFELVDQAMREQAREQGAA
jgi:hypothetical protein